MLKNNKNKIYDVIVIGGGASGMFAGVFASMRGKSVLLIDKNKSLGAKLKITGGGRCNITNAEYDVRKLLKNYGEGEQFLYSPFSMFGVKDTFDYFESRGLPLVVQARNRVFPETEKAVDVFKVLEKDLVKNKVEILNNCKAIDIRSEGKMVKSVKTDKGIFYGNAFIIATGGLSHPETGATGDGIGWLRRLGHTVKDPSPTVVPLEVRESWVKDRAGDSLSFMKISFYLDDKKQFSKVGKILFTHFGLSGPLILNSASSVAPLLKKGEVKVLIDLYPDTDIGSLESQIIKIFDENKNKNLRTVWKDIVPKGTMKSLEEVFTFVDFEKKVHSITKEERKKIVHLLKAIPVTITNLMGYDRAVVADGGVILSEIDMKTMRSKLFENLYVTGDLLHIHRVSGGYSLQLCWTTGYVAGMSA